MGLVIKHRAKIQVYIRGHSPIQGVGEARPAPFAAVVSTYFSVPWGTARKVLRVWRDPARMSGDTVENSHTILRQNNRWVYKRQLDETACSYMQVEAGNTMWL